jgi:hypothetical protein
MALTGWPDQSYAGDPGRAHGTVLHGETDRPSAVPAVGGRAILPA